MASFSAGPAARRQSIERGGAATPGMAGPRAGGARQKTPGWFFVDAHDFKQLALFNAKLSPLWSRYWRPVGRVKGCVDADRSQKMPGAIRLARLLLGLAPTRGIFPFFRVKVRAGGSPPLPYPESQNAGALHP